MAENKPGVVLYFEALQAIESLDAEDTKKVISAILHYARDNETPSFSGTLAAFWFMVQAGLDRDGDKYNSKRQRGVWLTYCRKCKEDGIESLSFEAWEAQRAVNDSLPCVEHTVNECINEPSPTTSPTTSPSPTTTKNNKESMCAAAPSRPAKPDKQRSEIVRHKHGEYGWVLLSEEEYQRLEEDLGPEELDRCIRYVDESAQSNGNKNKWKDWNLVLRKCSRERWGAKQREGGNYHGQPSGCSAADQRQRTEAEWLGAFRPAGKDD